MRKIVFLLVALSCFMLTAPALAQSNEARENYEHARIFHKSRYYEQEARLLLKSAEQGYAKAQFKLGLMYYIGEGVAIDHQQTLKWFNKAAMQGDISSQYNLGLLFQGRGGIEENYPLAYAMFLLAYFFAEEDKSLKEGIGKIARNLRRKLTLTQIQEGRELAKNLRVEILENKKVIEWAN